jgi:hypothetical protein
VQPKLLKFYCIIPIVVQKFSLSMKNAENLDAKELIEVPYINISNFPTGIFFIQLDSDDGPIYVEKLVVLR